MHSMQCHVRTHVFVVLYGTFDLFSSETCHKDCIKTILDMVQNTLVCPMQFLTVLRYMPNFYQKLVCITRHAIPFYQRQGWNTEHTNSFDVTMTFFFFEVPREGLRPGWNCRHGKLFTQRPGWSKGIWGKFQCVLNN